MSWLSKFAETVRCGFHVYTCAKFSHEPIKCVEELKCEVPKRWKPVPAQIRDEVEQPRLKLKF